MTLAATASDARRRPLRAWARHAVALLFFCLMAVLHTWPLASAPGRLSRHDNGDALLNEWVVAWVEHQLPRDPLHLFDANIFYPEKNTLAFSEHLFLQGALGLPLSWAGFSTTTIHNVLVLLGLTLTGWATYLVMVRWTGDLLASVLSGCLMAFNAHTLTRLAHLQAMHVEFLPFAVLALHQLLERPSWGRAVALSAFFTLQGLASNYLLVFTVLALAAAALVRPDGWWGSRGRRLAGPLLVAAALAALALTPFLLPYYRAHHDQGLHRPLEEVGMYSATWRDYLATGGRLHFDTWNRRIWTGRGTPLFPGVTALLLSGLAIATGAIRDRRARMWVALGAAGMWLSFGPTLPGYVTLCRIFPLLQGIRAPVRIGFLMLTAVAVLAGFGLVWLRRRCGDRTRLSSAIAIAAVAIVTVEALRAPVGLTPALTIPPVYHALALEPAAIVVEYPLPSPVAAFRNAEYMLYSTRHWKPLVNGYSGFLPDSYRRNWERINRFPQPDAMRALVELGVTHVVLHGAGRVVAAERMPGLTRVASAEDMGIYRLDWKQVSGVLPAR